ncbi:MAG: type II secretion system minor pseudopilin GspI [Pseudomonadota bacterium]
MTSEMRHTQRPPGSTGGFTLIELLVAVTVVAVSLAAAFQTINQASFGTARMQERTLASWIALNRIAELRLQPTIPEIGRSDGEVEFGPAEWVWEAEVSATQVEALRRVEVVVRYTRDGDSLATVVGFIGQPPAPGGAPAPWAGIPGGQPGTPGLPGNPTDPQTPQPGQRGGEET